MDYTRCAEEFTETELAVLNLYFSNTDQPVFAIKNLPEVIRGAMFARYSRYQGGLRRMFLDEFAADLDHEKVLDTGETEKAAGLYERVFVGYGDDSIAQVGGAHIACEYVSNILTKVLQRGRLAAYLEQSTRYIPYDGELPGGGFRYYSDDALGSLYRDNMNELFRIYASSLPVVRAYLEEQYPRESGQSEGAWNMSLKAKTFDLLRGILPAGTLSHVGMFGSGQAYENMIMRMLASPLPEANDYGQRILQELNTVIPSFLSRIERPDRGGAWVKYFQERNEEIKIIGSTIQTEPEPGNSVRLLRTRGDLDELIASGLFEYTGVPEDELLLEVRGWDERKKEEAFWSIVGDRQNRRHRPSRGFEAVSYRFEIVSDYGAFRDLQRHRMLTCEWQDLTPELGAEIPDELPAEIRAEYEKALGISKATHQALASEGKHKIAQYALCLGYRIRYILDMNAREAMQLTELRSGVEGHPGYRAVAQQMHRVIGETHPLIAESMKYIDSSSEPRLERLLSEIRTEKKRAALDSNNK